VEEVFHLVFRRVKAPDYECYCGTGFGQKHRTDDTGRTTEKKKQSASAREKKAIGVRQLARQETISLHVLVVLWPHPHVLPQCRADTGITFRVSQHCEESGRKKRE
jgi:hypothetical protein